MTFSLSTEFIKQFEDKQPNWGTLGYVTYKRTYSRTKPDGTSEEYWETVKRVVEGTFEIYENHLKHNKLPYDEKRTQILAQEMYKRIWEFKFTPPGRGFWMMGTDYIRRRGSMPLNNCGFVSTEFLHTDGAEPFCFMMDSLMLGVGVGGDTKGAGQITLAPLKYSKEPFVVPDSREGWVEALRLVLNAFFGLGEMPSYISYEKVRPAGAEIKGFGGISSGPEPLIKLIDNVMKLLGEREGEQLTSSDIVDIFNFVGKCVVSGNVRRSAEIMFGNPKDKEFLNLKNPELHKEELMDRRWASNNSIFAEIGMDYSEVAEMTAKNGEPGYEWLGNAQDFGRMDEKADGKDWRASGGNPCLEQTLESYELCCLVETYPSKHETLEEWRETLYFAFLYAKIVTLLPTHNEKTNAVMARNRRIGCSASGIVQAFKKFGRRETLINMYNGYNELKEIDEMLSEEFAVPKSIKITSVKPSGTVSLLAGVTPGIHYPQSEYYIRNIRIQEGMPLLDELKAANYPIEKDKYSDNTYVVSFPVKEEYFDRTVADVSMWEQLENAAQVQGLWADNQVSVTINFKPEEAKDIKNALELYETRLKGVSFLPYVDHGYEQAPYIPISKEEYEKLSAEVTPIEFKKVVHDQVEKFCDSTACQI